MGESKRQHRYRHAEGKRWIEVRIKNAQQLFDARDPAPFRERDLDDDFVDYVVSSAREFRSSTPLKLVIYIEESEAKSLAKDSVREAIRSFMSYKIDLQRSELKVFLRQAQLFLMIGLMILGVCVAISEQLKGESVGRTISILREGIVIFGWVSIWKPIELILFDWYPLFERLRLYKRLLMTEIDIKYAAGAD